MKVTVETSDNITYWLVETTCSETTESIIKNAYNKTALIEKLEFDKNVNTAESIKLAALNNDLDTLINNI